jgi:hypothetical protein
VCDKGAYLLAKLVPFSCIVIALNNPFEGLKVIFEVLYKASVAVVEDAEPTK